MSLLHSASNSMMSMNKPELYISLDIETNGPCPGLNSMLSLGAAAFFNGNMVAKFYRKLEPLSGPDFMEDSDTMTWWETQPEAWEEVNKDKADPQVVMTHFGEWLNNIGSTRGAKLVAAAWPAAFDFGYVNYYSHQYYGENPLGFACLDMRSYANGLFNTAGYYERISEGDLYKYFNIDRTDLQPHIAIDDAIGQGRLLMALIREAESRKS